MRKARKTRAVQLRILSKSTLTEAEGKMLSLVQGMPDNLAVDYGYVYWGAQKTEVRSGPATRVWEVSAAAILARLKDQELVDKYQVPGKTRCLYRLTMRGTQVLNGDIVV